MTFKKPFTFFQSKEGNLKVVPKWTETQKLNLEHGFWSYSIEQTKSKYQRRLEKDTRRINNLINRAVAETKETSSPVLQRFGK